jgi:hypothetical protein
MAATMVVLWVATFVIAVLLIRRPMVDRATAWAVRLGVLVAMAGMAVRFLMTTPTAAQLAGGRPTMVGAHTVGVPDGGPGLPMTGWSTTAGDLRVPHFIGIHALQALPLLVFALAVLARRFPALRDAATRLRLVLAGAGLYAGLLAVLTWQALRGQSLVHPDALTLGVAGVLVTAAAVATGAALRPRRHW